MVSQSRPAPEPPAPPAPALARRVIVGLAVFCVGLALNAGLALLKVPPFALLIALAGFVVMSIGGGGPHVPTKPEQFRAIGRAAQWSETGVMVLLTAALGLALAGVAVMFGVLLTGH